MLKIAEDSWGAIMYFDKILQQSNFKEFIRIVISDDKLMLFHFRNKTSIKTLNVLLKENQQIFNYLSENPSVFVEVIISSNTIVNRSINLRNLKESDIKTLATNLLLEKKETTNLVAYEKKLSYRNGSTNICHMNLSSTLFSILNDLLNLENPISTVSTWPIWLVSSYFQAYPMDLNKFEVSLFVGEYDNRWEIIATQNKKIISYRQGNIENYNKKTETDNMLKYICHAFNISLDNIVIYSTNSDTINEFTDISPINMSLISKSGNFLDFNKKQNLNMIFKAACIIGFLIVFSSTIFDIFKIFDYKNHIQNNENLLNEIPDGVVSDIALWNKLKEYNYDHHIKLKSELQKDLDIHKKLKNLSIRINEKTNKLTVNTIYEK